MVCLAGGGRGSELLKGLYGVELRVMWLCCMELWLERRDVSGIIRENGSK
jgi:hypothetical protein